MDIEALEKQGRIGLSERKGMRRHILIDGRRVGFVDRVSAGVYAATMGADQWVGEFGWFTDAAYEVIREHFRLIGT